MLLKLPWWFYAEINHVIKQWAFFRLSCQRANFYDNKNIFRLVIESLKGGRRRSGRLSSAGHDWWIMIRYQQTQIINSFQADENGFLCIHDFHPFTFDLKILGHRTWVEWQVTFRFISPPSRDSQRLIEIIQMPSASRLPNPQTISHHSSFDSSGSRGMLSPRSAVDDIELCF